MKKLIFILISCLLFCSCQKSLYDNSNTEQVISNCVTSQVITIDNVAPKTAKVVMYKGDTLAVQTEKFSIEVPRDFNSLIATRSSSVTGIFDMKVVGSIRTYSQYWQAVMFEDTETGDYDYNDLVFHIRNICESPWNKDYSLQSIDIQPIALGSTKTIELGYILSDGTEHIVSTDVRKDLFNDAKGFINSSEDFEPVRFNFSSILSNYKLERTAHAWIVWYIKVDGKKHCAVSNEVKLAMINEELMPYGLVNYSTFNYPFEHTSLFSAYPNAREWINGTKSTIGDSDKNLVYPSKILWDYEDLKK